MGQNRFDNSAGCFKPYSIMLSELMGPTPGHNQAVVVDFVDAEIGVLDVSAKKRLSAYRSLVATG